MANVAKLEETLDYIRMNREQHNQRGWALKTECGTTMCFAGWAVVLAGYEFIWSGTPAIFSEPGATPVEVAEEHAERCIVPGVDSPIRVYPLALLLLDLDTNQADALFFQAKTFDDVERTVKDLINEQSLDAC